MARRRHKEPSNTLATRVLLDKVSLEEALIFKGCQETREASEDWLLRKLDLARHRIIGVFAFAVDPISQRGSENFLLGAGPKIGELAGFVGARITHWDWLVSESDLNDRFGRLPRFYRKHLVANLVRRMIVEQLLALRDKHEIYYMDGGWQMIQSVADEYRLGRIVAGELFAHRKVIRLKDDHREWHGVNRGQAENRGWAPGKSIGGVAAYVS